MRDEKDREDHCRGVLGECESMEELAPTRQAEECAPILGRRFPVHWLYGIGYGMCDNWKKIHDTP